MPLRWRSACFLHGLGSSPLGVKASFFRARFADEEVPYAAPDLNVPSFAGQTISAQLEVIRQTLEGLPRPALLIGSSLGGLAAIRYAYLHPPRGGRRHAYSPRHRVPRRAFGPVLRQFAGTVENTGVAASAPRWRAHGGTASLRSGGRRRPTCVPRRASGDAGPGHPRRQGCHHTLGRDRPLPLPTAKRKQFAAAGGRTIA